MGYIKGGTFGVTLYASHFLLPSFFLIPTFFFDTTTSSHFLGILQVMKRTTYIALGVVLVASLIGFFVVRHYTAKPSLIVTKNSCTTDVMICPDGTSVPRSGPDCKFGVCKQTLPSYLEQPTSTPNEQPLPQESVATEPLITTNLFDKITSIATSLFMKVSDTVQGDITSGITDTTNSIPTNGQPAGNTQGNAVTTPVVDEVRYLVIRNNTLVDQNNNVIYTFPPSFNNSSGTGGFTENHFINAVAVNQVAPVVGAIPIDGQSGKYYLSENSFGITGGCQFSNKIYILDTIANTKTLLYEENSSTLENTDPRACTSEIYLLATEAEKLILKYHTIGTNMICDSTWSEPEKTWFLDVTKTEKGTRIYPISPARYSEAESFEAKCRDELVTSTSTQ
jgi:hypothetical protein